MLRTMEPYNQQNKALLYVFAIRNERGRRRVSCILSNIICWIGIFYLIRIEAFIHPSAVQSLVVAKEYPNQNSDDVPRLQIKSNGQNGIPKIVEEVGKTTKTIR